MVRKFRSDIIQAFLDAEEAVFPSSGDCMRINGFLISRGEIRLIFFSATNAERRFSPGISMKKTG